MGHDDLDYCDANFRYRITEVDGELRFTDFEVVGELAGSRFATVVSNYFRNRPLAAVRREDVDAMRAAGDIRCLHHIIEHVLALRRTLGR